MRALSPLYHVVEVREDESNVTLFIGSNDVPLATWEDENGKLHLSRLNLTADTKIGVELSNLSAHPCWRRLPVGCGAVEPVPGRGHRRRVRVP